MIKKYLYRSRLSSRITALNLGILILVLAAVIVLSLIAVTDITDTASRRIAHLHSQDTVNRLISHLNSDLVLLRMVANSSAVQEWFADEHNYEKKYAALSELLGIAPFLQVPEFYMGVAGSLNEYIVGLTTTVDDFVSHGRMSPYVAMDEWFFDMMGTDLSFTFNVDIDKATHTWNIWILYRVVHDGRDVGLLCIPFRIDYVLGDVFGQYDDEFISGYVVDGSGFIHIESDVFDHYALWEYESVHVSYIDAGLGEFVYNFTRRDEFFFAEDAQIEVVRLRYGHHDYAAIAPIPHSTWMIITMFDSRVLFSIADIIPVIIILVSAFIGFAFVSIFTMRRGVLMPLESLTKSVSLVNETEADVSKNIVYGESRTDEIGDLSRTITNMLKKIWSAAAKEQELLERVFEEQKRIGVAEESNKAKSRFLARMSHEIRTPINVVMGISAIHLQDPDLPPKMEESLVKIHNSSNLLLGIVNDILDLSRIESGKMTISNEKYDVASMINDVASLYMVNPSNENIKYLIFVDEKLPAALIGDMLRIEQIISNLLSNAIKYTEFGSVEISFLREDSNFGDDSITLVVCIRDTGLGMTPEQVAVLSGHSDYTRFHENENRFISGTGLGIPITYSIAEIMEAKIDIESQVGKGTNVVVRIPQKIANTKVLGLQIAHKLQQFQTNMRADTKRFDFTPKPMPYGKVLVVDDTEANLYVAKGLLAFYNLQIETCGSGNEAIEKIEAGNVYDIIFMDNMMPDRSGTESMIILRDMGYNEPIIVFTASALLGQMEEFMKSGFDGYISKPIQPKVLDSMLNKFIRDKKSPEVVEAAIAASDKQDVADKPDISDYQFSDELVNKLRKDFVRKYKNTVFEITNALNTDDIKTAHRLSHTLKSVAGLIHEQSLIEAAERVERILEVGEKPTAQQLSIFENELKRVIEDIGEDELLPMNEVAYMSNGEALALLEKIEPLLTSHNTASRKMLGELRKIPQSALLCTHIEGFNFKAALETLLKLRVDLGGE